MKQLGTNTFRGELCDCIMAGTRIARLALVFLSSIAALSLMMLSVDPQTQYTVDELMNSPNDFQDSEVFVRGVVSNGTVFSNPLTFQLDGLESNVTVDYSMSPIPDGFAEGRTIAVRGLLSFYDGIWVLESTEIQTGCPSKYES